MGGWSRRTWKHLPQDAGDTPTLKPSRWVLFVTDIGRCTKDTYRSSQIRFRVSAACAKKSARSKDQGHVSLGAGQGQHPPGGLPSALHDRLLLCRPIVFLRSIPCGVYGWACSERGCSHREVSLAVSSRARTGEAAVASMVLGTEWVLNEYLLNSFQLMQES